jgi:hypothetical protein
MPEPKINHRFITCFQSSGRIGKSTMLEGILAWATFAGVPLAVVDCDAEHRTLSKRFPEAMFVDATRSRDKFLQLITSMPDLPLAVADFPAQATDFLLDAMESLRVVEALGTRETRMTVLMFAADDPTATASMAKTYRVLRDRVDYILVKNPARFRSQLFDESPLADLFLRSRVPVIEIPTLTATTLQAIAAASAEKRKHLTYVEAAKVASIPQICRFEIEYFINRMLVQCEDAARVLVPDPATTIKSKVFRPSETIARAAIDEFHPLNV